MENLSLEQQEFIKYPGCTSPYSEEGRNCTTCLTCPFRGSLLSASSLEDVSNDFSEASYWWKPLYGQCQGNYNL